jgi:hypothetical protein
MNALSFGPEGILFIGDSKSASVFAIETGDDVAIEKAEEQNIENIDVKLADALGTTPDNLSIQDMAVNPLSKKVYLSIHLADGSPALISLNNGEINLVSTSNILFSSVSINDAIAEDAKDRRGRSMRQWAISDLGYSMGNVMVSGLSNQEFGSTFRSIPFPFS